MTVTRNLLATPSVCINYITYTHYVSVKKLSINLKNKRANVMGKG